MSGYRKPGPLCGTTDGFDIGTLVRSQSPIPGSVCSFRIEDIIAESIARGTHTAHKKSESRNKVSISIDKKYTNNPYEVVTKHTKPNAKDVVSMLLSAWPELKVKGARTLTAQFMAETGEGKYCFNWNLGNVKAGPNDQHMYLNNVWEVISKGAASNEVKLSNGHGHIASADEIKKHGWACKSEQSIIVFSPPHPQCRFRAYDSLSDGASRWIAHHKRVAKSHSKYIDSLNNGDIASVAHILKQSKYYTAVEENYKRAMERQMSKIDHLLGPVA